MSLLILHRNPFEPFPYDRWLADYEGAVVVLADRAKFAPFGEPVPTGNLGYARLEVLDCFDEDLVVKRGLELAAEYDFTHVVGFHEAEVDPAARLREQLGLAGAWTEDVLPFRDKALMKERVQAAGVEVAPHTVARTADEARAFAAQHGFPLVCKDRAGFAAIGLRILTDEAQLERYLPDAYAETPRDDLLDGGVRARPDVPRRRARRRRPHRAGLAVPVPVRPGLVRHRLGRADRPHARSGRPLTDRLLALTDQILAALTPADSRLRAHGFHAEIFHTPDDRLVLCEIACRPGGAKIREVFHTLFGVQPRRVRHAGRARPAAGRAGGRPRRRSAAAAARHVRPDADDEAAGLRAVSARAAQRGLGAAVLALRRAGATSSRPPQAPLTSSPRSSAPPPPAASASAGSGRSERGSRRRSTSIRSVNAELATTAGGVRVNS